MRSIRSTRLCACTCETEFLYTGCPKKIGKYKFYRKVFP